LIDTDVEQSILYIKVYGLGERNTYSIRANFYLKGEKHPFENFLLDENGDVTYSQETDQGLDVIKFELPEII